MHGKPIGLLNVSGFFDPLLRFLDQLVEQRFVRPEHRELLLVSEDSRDLLARMAAYRSSYLPKWISAETS